MFTPLKLEPIFKIAMLYFVAILYTVFSRLGLRPRGVRTNPTNPPGSAPDLNLPSLDHIRHILNTQKTVHIHTVFPMLQRHPTHPSHHHPFRSLQTMCNVFRPLQTLESCSLHRPVFSPISCQYTLDTSLVYLSLRGV